MRTPSASHFPAVLPYHYLPTPSHTELSSVALEPIAQVWNATPTTRDLSKAPAARIIQSDDHLILLARFNDTLTSQPEATGYYEGLWNYSVVEFFFWNSFDTRYTEIHLGPNALWWYRDFATIRTPVGNEASIAELRQSITQLSGTRDKREILLLPYSILPEYMQTMDTLRGNICASIACNGRTLYYSYVKPLSDTIDFHQCELSTLLGSAPAHYETDSNA